MCHISCWKYDKTYHPGQNATYKISSVVCVCMAWNIYHFICDEADDSGVCDIINHAEACAGHRAYTR